MIYRIARKHLDTQEIEFLMEFDAQTPAEARMWFTGTIATMLEEDTTGEYRVVTAEDPEAVGEGGRMQSWFYGDGIYDKDNGLVIPYDKRATYLSEFILGDWQYYLEKRGENNHPTIGS